MVQHLAIPSPLLHPQVIQRIEERIARISFLPVENGEGLQVLRYEVRRLLIPMLTPCFRLCS
jgi:hypothetical protein